MTGAAARMKTSSTCCVRASGARVTLRFEIVDDALERLSLGAQAAFVAMGEFCR